MVTNNKFNRTIIILLSEIFYETTKTINLLSEMWNLPSEMINIDKYVLFRRLKMTQNNKCINVTVKPGLIGI